MIHTRKSKKFRRKAAQILFTATAGDNTLHLRSQSNGFDCTIHWGDGTSSTCPVGGGNIIHNYAVAGDYIISIFGNSFAGFNVGNQTGKEKYKALYSFGKWINDTMTSAAASFRGCNQLSYIAPNALKYNKKITAITSMFESNAIAEIPSGLLDSLTDLVSCGAAFYDCFNITAVPPDLFRYNTKVTSFKQVFITCDKLTNLPPDLFKYNTAVTDMSYAFRYCPYLIMRDDLFGLDFTNRFSGKTVNFTEMSTQAAHYGGTQGRAPELWNFTGGTFTKSLCFSGSGNNAASLSNYADIPAEWR